MAAEEGDSNFVSQLNEKSKEKAKTELHELNDKDRELAVQTFRTWVLEQDWLKTPTDFEFLLRFLRVRKFSQLGARQTLENYWTCKTKMPKFQRGIDPADPFMQELIRTGFFYGHKKVDSEGRRLMFNGVALPIRVKGVYFYNEPTFLDVLMTFFTQFMTPKFKDRLAVVGKNLVNLYEVVDKSMLPTEYLPDDYTGPNAGPMDKVIDEMIEDMQKPEFRDHIRAVTSTDYGVDLQKRKGMEQEPAASFRKLNVE